MPTHVRAYLYRVGAAVLPLLVILGIVTQEVAAELYLILAAVFAVGEGGIVLAALNTSTERGN